MKKRWVFNTPPDSDTVQKLSEELNIPKALAVLLVQRGISNYEQSKKFFRPDLTDLHDPFLMKDMEKAVLRMESAIEQNQKILIYGDYDVDGTTAVALVYSFLSTFYSQIDYYIPDRYKEGYGISNHGIDYAADNNFALIIALDCGIKSIDKVEYAKSKGIDFIICDHHRPGNEIPNAIAVLDPKRIDCDYPFKELTGCGIGLKLVQAFAQKTNFEKFNLATYLDLAVVSIAADIVPIVGENRVLAYYGLKQLNTNPREGFKAMLQLAGRKNKSELTITDIVFTIAPRINAAGRLESGKKAVELLLSDNNELALGFGNNLNDTNSERKNIDKQITEEAMQTIALDANFLSKKSTVVFQNNWHKGVVGIVASRLIEKYYRPTIVLTESNGMATGSARSVKNFDVYNAIEACADLLEQFGGHKYAAGLSLKLENLDAFKIKFEAVVASSINENDLVPEIEIDLALDFTEISPKFHRIIKQFAPFGPENMAPVFATHNIVDKGYAKIVGENHLKFDAVSKKDGIEFPAIAFGLSQKLPLLKANKPLSVCYSIEENEWRDTTLLQLQVKDIESYKESRD